jgi:hypothetical protein
MLAWVPEAAVLGRALGPDATGHGNSSLPVALAVLDENFLPLEVHVLNVEPAQLSHAKSAPVEHQDHDATAPLLSSATAACVNQMLGFLESQHPGRGLLEYVAVRSSISP